MPAHFSSLLLKRMEHIYRIPKLSHVNYPPFAQNVDPYFICARPDCLYGLPVARIKSILNRAELETCSTAGLIREVSKIVQTRSHEFQRFHSRLFYMYSKGKLKIQGFYNEG